MHTLASVCPSGTSLVDGYTVPDGPVRMFTSCPIANNSGSDLEATIEIAPGGASHAATHLVWQGTVLGDGSTPPVQVNRRIFPTDKIRVKTSVANAAVFQFCEGY